MKVSGALRYWRQTPPLARAAFVLAALVGVYFVSFFGYAIVMSAISGGGTPPPGRTNPPALIGVAMGLVFMVATLAGVLAPLVLVAVGLRSTSATFNWVAVWVAAIIGVAGLGFGVAVAIATGLFQHPPDQTGIGAFVGEAGSQATLWIPAVVTAIGCAAIATVGALRAMRSRPVGQRVAATDGRSRLSPS